jgi:hypothetical protein
MRLALRVEELVMMFLVSSASASARLDTTWFYLDANL